MNVPTEFLDAQPSARRSAAELAWFLLLSDLLLFLSVLLDPFLEGFVVEDVGFGWLFQGVGNKLFLLGDILGAKHRLI